MTTPRTTMPWGDDGDVTPRTTMRWGVSPPVRSSVVAAVSIVQMAPQPQGVVMQGVVVQAPVVKAF